MRPSRLLAIAAATAASTALALGSNPAVGQEPAPHVTVDPSGGPAGTVVTISGEGCTGNGVLIQVEYVGDDGDRSITIPMGSAADGSWSVTHTIREDDPLGTYTLQTTCYTDASVVPPNLTPMFDYADASFEVTDGTTPPVPTVIPLDVSPTSGPVGTAVSVSGTDCSGDAVELALLEGTSIDDITAVVDAWSTDPAEDGSWSGELLVYDTMFTLDDAEIDVVPGGDYFVVAACAFYPSDVPEAGPDHVIFSEPVDFDITGDGTAPRTDPPPGTAIVPLTSQAQPAVAVAADPTYTG